VTQLTINDYCMNPINQIILRVSDNKISVDDLADAPMSAGLSKFAHAKISLSPNLASIPLKAGMLVGSVQGLKKSIEVVLAAHQLRPIDSDSVVAGEVTIVFKTTHSFQSGSGKSSKKKMLQTKTAACRLINMLFGIGLAAIYFRTEGNRIIFQVFVVPIVRDGDSLHLNSNGDTKVCSPTWKLSAHEFFSRRKLIAWHQSIQSQKIKHP